MKDFFENVVYEPWPWWIGGPLIGVFVTVLLLIENKQLGISSSYQYICSKLSPIKLDYFKNPERSSWQFFFVIGLILGGVGLYYLNPTYELSISQETSTYLSSIGVEQNTGFVPDELYNFSSISIIYLLLGGVLIGFGARYANGCTAGHAIMGCAQLAPSSIISTVCFFLGGLAATYFIIPNLF